MREIRKWQLGASAAALAIILAACGGGGGSAGADGPTPAPIGGGPGATAENVTWDQWTPYVIPHDRTEPVLYEVAISGTVKGQVSIAGDNDIVLRDDGSNGDRVSGDGIWSALIAPSVVLARNTPARVHRPFIGQLKVSGTQGAFNVFAEVSSAAMPVAPVHPVDEGGQETAHVVNYVATRAQLAQPDRNFWARRFYQKHGDDFDFVQVVLVAGRRDNRSYSSLRNAVVGIGKPLVDNSAQAGSKGRLLGVALYPMPSGFDPADKAFAHEIGHQWINFLPGAPFNAAQPHWPQGSIGANIMGANLPGTQVGGDHPFVYEPAAGGYQIKAAAPGQTSVFNLMELYMMGLVLPVDVPDYVVLKDQKRAVSAGTQLADSEVQIIRIADVIAAAGVRKPDAMSAQRHFRVATIVVSERPLNALEMSFYDFFARRAEATTTLPCAVLLGEGTCYPWYLATGGRSTMTSRLR